MGPQKWGMPSVIQRVRGWWSTQPEAMASPPFSPKMHQRHPQRVSITLPQQVFDALIARSLQEGRSLSNLSAYLLEWSLRYEADGLCNGLPHNSPRR